MHWLELKIPPPVLALLVAVFMWLTSWFIAPFPVALGIRVGILVVLGLVAVGISAAGLLAFRRARTTINPTKPNAASSLVRTGIFRFTRNPMYLGLLLWLLAWAVFLANVLAFLFLPVFVIYMNRFQIYPEERALSSLFDGEYTAYQETVRRWL